MVDPLEPDDGEPVLPPGPRRSTYTPPPVGARYEPGSLTGEPAPMPSPSPAPVSAPTSAPVAETSPVAPPPAPQAVEQPAPQVVWQVDSAPPAAEPDGVDAPAPGIPSAQSVAEQLGIPGVPPPPERASLSDDELAAVLDPAKAPPGSTAELIELFEQQLTLRAQEAQRLSLWEQAVRESGVPHADDLVESVRSGFTGVIDIVAPAAAADDPWARYPGASGPTPADESADGLPLVLPPIVADAPAEAVPPIGQAEPEASADAAPVTSDTGTDSAHGTDSDPGTGADALAQALAASPPPFGLVPSAVVPPPVTDDAPGAAADSQPEPAAEPEPTQEPEPTEEPATATLAGSEPPPLIEPEPHTGAAALERLFLDEASPASAEQPLVAPALPEPTLPQPALADPPAPEPAVAEQPIADTPRPMPAAPLGAPTGPILTNPAAVAAAALGFDELLRDPGPAAASSSASPASLPQAIAPGPIASSPIAPTPIVPSSSAPVATGSQAVPVVDSGERTNPPALRVEASALEPTPVALRAGRSIRLFWLWFAVTASVVSVGLGGVLIGLGMSLRQAILSALVGVAVSFLPLGLGTLAGKWSGQPTMVVSRATFGIVGNLLPAILAVVTRLLWAAALLGMLGASVTAGLRAAGIAEAVDPLALSGGIATAGLVVAAAIAGFGYGMIAIVAAVASVLACILVVIVLVVTAPALDMDAALAIPDGDWSLVVTGAVLVFSLVGLAWANSAGDLARYQAKGTIGAGAVLFASFGATLPAFALVAWGAALASSDPELGAALATDPIAALAGLLPAALALPLVLAVAVSLLAAAALALYSGGFALLATGIRTSRPMSVVIGVVVTGAIAAPLVAGAPSLEVLLRDVLTTLAVPVAAWAGIFGAETMIRTRRVHSPSLLQSGGVYPPVRWVNTAMLVVASVIGWGFTSASLALLDGQGYLWRLTGATGPVAESDAGVAVALLIGLLTPIVAGIPAVRRLQEAESRAVLDS